MQKPDGPGLVNREQYIMRRRQVIVTHEGAGMLGVEREWKGLLLSMMWKDERGSLEYMDWKKETGAVEQELPEKRL